MNVETKELKPESEISAIKKLYDSIKDGKLISVIAIECLERTTGYVFINTKDFCTKMEQFIGKHYYRGADLRRERKGRGKERSELAEMLGVSINTVRLMETNKKPLSQDAIDFIIAMGFKKTVPLKKLRKRAYEPNSVHCPKIEKIPPEKKLKKLGVSDLIECDTCNKEKEHRMIKVEKASAGITQLICQYSTSKKKEKEKQKDENGDEIQIAA